MVSAWNFEWDKFECLQYLGFVFITSRMRDLCYLLDMWKGWSDLTNSGYALSNIRVWHFYPQVQSGGCGTSNIACDGVVMWSGWRTTEPLKIFYTLNEWMQKTSAQFEIYISWYQQHTEEYRYHVKWLAKSLDISS